MSPTRSAGVAVAVAATACAGWQVAHRTSPLVRAWAPSGLPRRSAGPLSVLDSGPGDGIDEDVLVLLHGLGATGDYFGAFYDDLRTTRRVVIVDLLGFGHSLDEARTDFSVDAHVDALDQAFVALGVAESAIVLAAHSMASAIALTWADRHRARARHVHLWAPPIYPVGSAAETVGKEYGLMSRLFALDTTWAERACRINCMHRDVSGRVMAAMVPRWPTGVSRGASRHTWAAYHGSLRSLILDFDWSVVLPAAVPVTIYQGSNDRIGDRAHTAQLAGTAQVVTVAGADHHIALEHPELLHDALGA